MAGNYWLDLFTGTTWEEFLSAGGNISGFREGREKICKKIKPGDYFLCYCTGIKRWIGLLEVKGPVYYEDKRTIWSQDPFPWRFPVEVLIALKPEHAVPILNLRDKLSYFKDLKNPSFWSGHFRGSPAREKQEDALVVISAMEKAKNKPIDLQYDERKYHRIPSMVKTYQSNGVDVSIPEDIEEEEIAQEISIGVSHEEIQWRLIALGGSLGLKVHIARNDRNREYKGNKFKEMDGVIEKLKLNFQDPVIKTIENIDVLWLDGTAIVAAFEVEHTSAIYSGLLRMSDLLAMQSNIEISLYIVAPDDRRNKVFEEILRPTFSKMARPLWKSCQFIPYSSLKGKMEEVSGVLGYLKPEFIAEIAEPITPDEL